MRLRLRILRIVFLCSVLLLTLIEVANGAPAGKKDGKGKAPASSQESNSRSDYPSQKQSQSRPCSSHGMPHPSQEEIEEWQEIGRGAGALLKDPQAVRRPGTSRRMQESKSYTRTIRRPADIPDRVNRAEMERNRDACFALCHDLEQKALECAASDRDCWQMLGEIRAKMEEDEQQRAHVGHVDLVSSESENSS